MLNPVFRNQERSGYEELVSYGPHFYKDILEMDANYRFAGKTLDTMAQGLEDLISNQFIDYANEGTILRLEKWLGIETDFSKSLEERRKKVKLAWNGGEKFNATLIKRMIRSHTGCANPTVRMTTYLSIDSGVSPEESIYMSDLIEQFEKMKPAHVRMNISIKRKCSLKVNVFAHVNVGEVLKIKAHLEDEISSEVGGLQLLNYVGLGSEIKIKARA